MGPGLQRGRRLVEANVTVGADAENLHVDSPGPSDRALVAVALLHRVRGRAIQEVNAFGGEVDATEEVRVHEAAKTARVRRRNPDEFIEVERGGARQIDPALLDTRRQLLVEADWRPARREPEHQGRPLCQLGGNTVGQGLGDGAFIGEDRNARGTGGSHHAD